MTKARISNGSKPVVEDGKFQIWNNLKLKFVSKFVLRISIFRFFYRGEGSVAPALRVHFVKSISWRQPLQVCFLSNSSEKISTTFPQLGHLHTKDFRSLNCSKPGQCRGILILLISFFQFLQRPHQILQGRSLVDIVDGNISNDSLLIDDK